MKKFVVLGLVMMLVMGMSVVVGAQELANDSVLVEVTVDKYATIEFDVDSVI